MMRSLQGDRIKAKFAHIDLTNSYVKKERVYLKQLPSVVVRWYVRLSKRLAKPHRR